MLLIMFTLEDIKSIVIYAIYFVYLITLYLGSFDSRSLWKIRNMDAWNIMAGILQSQAIRCSIFIT